MLIRHLPPTLLICLSIFILSPLIPYSANSTEFSFGFINLLKHWSSYATIFSILLLILLRFLPPKQKSLLLSSITTLAICIYIQANLLPASYGPLDGSEIQWKFFKIEPLVDLIFWSSAFVFWIFAYAWLSKQANKILTFLVLIQICAIAPNFRQLYETINYNSNHENLSNFFKISPKPGALIILLDGFFAPAFDKILEQAPDLQSAFSDFTYFNNTVSDFTSTVLSVPAMLTGVPFDGSTSLDQYFAEVFQKLSILSTLPSEEYEVLLATMPQFCNFLKSKQCLPYTMLQENSSSTGSKHEAALLINLSIFKATPFWLKQRFFKDAVGPLKSINSPFNFQNQRPKDLHLTNALEFKEKLNIDTTTAKASVRFLHILIPHVPLRLDRNCQEIALQQKVTRQGYQDQARCALRLTLDIIAKLKKLNVYEQQNIIITADHGINSSFGLYDKKYAKSHRLFRHTRALPLLLIKPAQAKNPQLQINETPLMLSDIAPTIQKLLVGKTIGQGQSIFDITNTNRTRITRDLQLRWKMWGKGLGSKSLVDHDKYEVNGNPRQQSNWRNLKQH